MVDTIWSENPLVQVVNQHPDDPETTWAPTPLLLLPKTWEGGGFLKFNAKFIADGSRSTLRFHIEVKELNSSGNAIRTIIDREHRAQRGTPNIQEISLPINDTSLSFRVIVKAHQDHSLAGVDTWYQEETRDYSVKRMRGSVLGIECFIATAAYGSELAPPVEYLREFRDNVVLPSKFGGTFDKILETYYKFSPPIAEAMYQHKYFKYFMKYTIVVPFVFIVKSAAHVTYLFTKREK